MKRYVVASFKVTDFQRFKDELDAVQDTLRGWGFAKTYLNRDLDNPNHLIIVHEVEDLDKVRQFYDSPDFKQCMEKAGVLESQRFFTEELARMDHLVSV